MIYTFKSPAAGNLIMLQANAERILEIIGKSPGPQGIVTPDQMPAAISALEAAVGQESSSASASDAAGDNTDAPQGADAVSLKQRALPFIDMLKRCQKAGKEIVWGV